MEKHTVKVSLRADGTAASGTKQVKLSRGEALMHGGREQMITPILCGERSPRRGGKRAVTVAALKEKPSVRMLPPAQRTEKLRFLIIYIPANQFSALAKRNQIFFFISLQRNDSTHYKIVLWGRRRGHGGEPADNLYTHLRS